MWNPWRRLRALSHVTLVWRDELPGGVDGLTIFESNEILMRNGMEQAQRRSILTHELIHVERGAYPRWREPHEERLVCAAASRRLITLEQLADALLWCYDPWEAAEHLHVDVPTVLARLEGLSEGEVRELNARLDYGELRLP